MRPHTVFDFLQTPVTVRFVQLIDLIRHDQDIFVVRFQPDEHLHIDRRYPDKSINDQDDQLLLIVVSKEIPCNQLLKIFPVRIGGMGKPVSGQIDEIAFMIDQKNIDLFRPAGQGACVRQIFLAREGIDDTRFSHVRPADECHLWFFIQQEGIIFNDTFDKESRTYTHGCIIPEFNTNSDHKKKD